MAVTNYYTVDGEILGQESAGNRTDFLADALGSVTGTVDNTSGLQNTYRYKMWCGKECDRVR